MGCPSRARHSQERGCIGRRRRLDADLCSGSPAADTPPAYQALSRLIVTGPLPCYVRSGTWITLKRSLRAVQRPSHWPKRIDRAPVVRLGLK